MQNGEGLLFIFLSQSKRVMPWFTYFILGYNTVSLFESFLSSQPLPNSPTRCFSTFSTIIFLSDKGHISFVTLGKFLTKVPVVLDGGLGSLGERLGPGLTETERLRLSSVNKINSQKVLYTCFFQCCNSERL